MTTKAAATSTPIRSFALGADVLVVCELLFSTPGLMTFSYVFEFFIFLYVSADLRKSGAGLDVATGFGDLGHAILHRALDELLGAQRIRVTGFDLIPHLVQGWHGLIRGEGGVVHGGHRLIRGLLHLRLISLRTQLVDLVQLVLQAGLGFLLLTLCFLRASG